MLLKDLSDYYDTLLEDHPDEVAHPGWSVCFVKGFLEIDQNGRLVNIVPAPEKRGVSLRVPEQVKKTSGIKANFLCDAAPYLLGIPARKKPGSDASDDEHAAYAKDADRARRCFEASRELHHELLDAVDSPLARAILAHYDSWKPSEAADDLIVSAHADVLAAGGFFTFSLLSDEDGRLAIHDVDITAAWDEHYAQDGDASELMRCLVTGDMAPVARLHPSVKGVAGAQSSGASLVSFNERSSESYGHVEEQGRNAPVSKRAAQAYGASLNYLLSNRAHHACLGDTTIAYWSDRCDHANTEFMSLLAFGGGAFADIKPDEGASAREQLDGTIRRLIQGKPVEASGLDLDAPFHIVGLAPNAARLSVSFVLKSRFGDVVENIAEHYRCLEIAAPRDSRLFLDPYTLLRAVENPHSTKPVFSSSLAAPLLGAILSGGKYPMGLYQTAILRIRATQDNPVNRERAAIIKACLIRNFRKSKEEISVKLNERRQDIAYNLGRAFCLLESIQWNANDGKTNIASRFMNSASSAPAIAFPVLLRLANVHLNKIASSNAGLAADYKRRLAEVLGEDRVPAFPQRLTLDEQGDFFLGYYHQYASRFKEDKVSGDIQDRDGDKARTTANEEE